MARIRASRLSLPREVKQSLQLDSGEHPLAWAVDDDGCWYVGTDRALHLQPGNRGERRLGWEQIERADWHSEGRLLGLVEVGEWGEAEDRTTITVAEPGALLELLRERVTKSVLVTVYAPVRGRLGLSVFGRRSPVGDGPVTWSFVLAQGLRPDDMDVQQVAQQALAQAEAEVPGVPSEPTR
ncbi:MAG: hypothetical protein H0U36_13670 [Nocardioidaceae bacterium]|nr:hypothetical protein [Nocardioidaceae bacterium]